MKPSHFSGIDYAVVRKFKAPVEKFNNPQNFQAWCKELLLKFLNFEHKNESNIIHIDRKFAINKWKEFIISKEDVWSPAKRLLVFTSMVKNKGKNNKTIPPIVKEDILNDSISIISDKLMQDKDTLFSLGKLYRQKLKDYYLKDIPAKYTGWIEIESKKSKPEKYEQNLEKLKILSNRLWCTQKDTHAKTYLENGNMHIYLENGNPKLCLRISGCEIQEIQGEKNNSVIPIEYIKTLKEHLNNSKYLLSDDMEFIIKLSEIMD